MPEGRAARCPGRRCRALVGMAAPWAAVVAEMADVHRRILVRRAAAYAVLRVSGMLKTRSRMPRVVEPEPNRSVAAVDEVGHDRIVAVHDERGRPWKIADRCSPPLRHDLELAVPVELSRKRFPSVTTRGRVRESASGSAPSSTSKRPSSARRAVTSADVIPEKRFAPARFHARRVSVPRISAAIAVVVVFPFVADTSATPPGIRAARSSTAAGSTFQSTLPGSVVPPPRPTARESAPIPRAAARLQCEPYAHRRRAYREGRGRSCSGKLADCVERSKLFAEMARPRSPKRASVRIDEAELAAFRAGLRRRYTDEEILEQLRAAAERMGRSPTMREFAKDPGRARPPADGDRALRDLERGQARCRALPAPLPDARGAPRAAPHARDGARPHADRARSRGQAALAPLGVAVRAHVRLARQRAARGRVRGASGRGAPRAGRRAGSSARGRSRPPAEDGRLGRGTARRSRRSSRSGRCIGCSTCREGHGPRSSTSCASDFAPKASTSCRTGR